MSEKKKYRLITRSDFDGLVCAVLLKDLQMIDEIMFVHPKDMQDGKVTVSENDITTNLPYVPGCHLAFDHHHSETLRTPLSQRKNHVLDPSAPSAARVLYQYYGGHEHFKDRFDEIMAAVDKADAAMFTKEEILDPQGWNLLNFLMDARTGLGRFRHFRISNYQLMMELIGYCQNLGIDEILALPDIKERSDLYFSHKDKFEDQLRRCAESIGPITFIDLRGEDVIYTGNRFTVYTLFPDCEISVHLLWGLKKENTVFAAGKSIFKRDNPINIGELTLAHGGGGHDGAGTCQVPNSAVEATKKDFIEKISAAS